MITIPGDSKKHSVSSGSDLLGTIHYTKNINLDEPGYIKLSQRMAQLQSEKNDANMELPIAFGRTAAASTVAFHVVTSEDPFDVSIGTTAVAVTEDTASNNPNYTLDSHGRWFHNKWISTDDNGIYILDGSTWDAGDTSTLTTGKAHPIEVFRNKDRVCFGDGNTVKSFSESGGTLTLNKTLTLPSDFEVIGLAYSNYKMGVITQLSDTATGQNQDAYFFAWDGSTTEAGQGIETGSDRGLGVVPYKGSFALLTRTGQLRYFTGGGWQELAQLPFFSKDRVFGTSYNRDIYGDALLVEGDVIYINYNGLLASSGERYQRYEPNNPGGILAYDPQVGLYQKYSHSISPLSMLTVTSGNVNTSTDIMTATAGTIPSTGSQIKYVSDKSQLIGGLKTPRVYYCIRHTSSTFSLAETYEEAAAGVKINLTGTGAANNYFLALETYDFGVTLANNVGGMALAGADNDICNHMICGAQLSDFSSTSQYNSMELAVSGFENRGYFVTPKMSSAQTEDKTQKVQLRYRKLKTGDSIIVKVQAKDSDGLPLSTPQLRTSDFNQCSWTGTNAFATTADLSDAKTAFDAGMELECEVISGAGAGNMVKISDIAESAGTYAVTLAENVLGAAAGRYCDILIDAWAYVGTITSTDTDGYKNFNVAKNSPWVRFKVELRGVETTVEQVKIINAVHKQSS